MTSNLAEVEGVEVHVLGQLVLNLLDGLLHALCLLYALLLYFLSGWSMEMGVGSVPWYQLNSGSVPMSAEGCPTPVPPELPPTCPIPVPPELPPTGGA